MCKGRSLLPPGLFVALLMYCSVEKMMKRKILILYTLLVFVASFLGTFLVLQRMPTHTLAASTNWTMFQGNLGHSGFNGAETILNATTAPQMKVLWTRHAAGGISSQVVEANGLLYWGSWDGFEHASNPTTGADVWATNVGTTTPGGGKCCPPSAGSSGAAAVTSVPINGTTTSVAFVSGGNAALYALNASTGAILWSTRLGTSPSHMLWAGPVVYQGSAYVGVASYCDCPLVQGQLVQVNASTGAVQHTFNVVPNGCVGGGIWDTPSIDQATNILYVSTGTHSSCSQAGNLSMGLLALHTTDLSLVGSWLLPLAQGPGDSDFGSTPTLFPATIGGTVHQMVGLVNKNGVYYALDRANVSAGPLWHFQVSFGFAGGGGNNFSSSGWDGSRLYVAGGGTTINGTRCSGSLRALNPATGTPIWEACLGADVNSSIMAVPGLVVLGAGSQIVAVDAATGKQVFTFHDISARSHFVGSATIVNGNLYLGNEDGNLYAFGVSGTPAPPPPPPSSTPGTSKAPVSKNWYFAEGKVGQCFTESMTIENPSTVSCAVTIQYLLGSGGPVTVPVTVPPFSRYTESVNNDLHMSAGGSGYQTDSAIVSVTNAPCTGVVAERPMYFTNFKGVSSGTDVLGATHTGSDFYFADVSSLPSYHSYITILNPPGGATANLTATYYQGGTVLGTDTLAVLAGTRGTIIPKSFSQRVATWVHASGPVVVERPTYFSNYSSGNTHNVSGAASVVGAPAPTTDWRFAEGYTGGGFQENLLLANFGATAATGKVVLEYDNGTTLTNTVNVPAHDAMSLDVNNATATKQGTCAPMPCVPSQSVSAEITVSTGAIVAEREMFFQYNHFDRLTGRTVTAQGGTDVTGQSGPARATVYSFAEGYTNLGYDEWFTVQNPTANQETLSVTLVNGKSRYYTFPLTVGEHTRATEIMVDVVVQHLYQPTDGVGGYEVSVTVQGAGGGVFAAERPMYWNTGASGTQGGSDVIGYMGN